MFTAISALAITVGSAIKKELWDIIRVNFNNHETRLNAVESVLKKVPFIKFDLRNSASFSAATGLYYYESDDTFTITNVYLRIFEVGALTGNFEIDIKKSVTDLDGVSFVSVFTTKPSVNLSTASDYDGSINQVFDVGQINVAVGDFLRLDITSMPANGIMGKAMITAYGE